VFSEKSAGASAKTGVAPETLFLKVKPPAIPRIMQEAKTPATHFFMIALPVQTATLVLVANKSFLDSLRKQVTCHKAEFDYLVKSSEYFAKSRAFQLLLAKQL
jgi:hypothetical protein